MRARGLRLAARAAVLIGAVAAPAFGQQLRVVTETMTAAREAVRVYVHAVDLGRRRALPNPKLLPAPARAGQLVLVPGERLLLAPSGPGRTDRSPAPASTYLTAMRTSPLAPLHDADLAAPAGWRQIAPVVAESEDGPVLLAPSGRVDREGVWRGRVDVYAPPAAGGAGFNQTLASWPLPGAPAGAALAVEDRALFAATGPRGAGVWLCAADAPYDAPPRRVEALPASEGGFAPKALAAAGPGRMVLLASQPLGPEAGSLALLVDTERFELIGEPVRVPGVAAEADRALAGGGQEGRLWAATATPGRRFAYATELAVSEDGLRITAERPLLETRQPPVLAPRGGLTALAAGRRLEFLRKGRAVGAPVEFGSPVTALAWTARGLVVGEGPRLHLMRGPGAAPGAVVTLREGFVREVAVLPEAALVPNDEDGDGLSRAQELQRGTSPADPDTDGDGLTDGEDPEPLTPSPRLAAPRRLVFRPGEATVRTIRIAPRHGRGVTWALIESESSAPWLRAFPRSGATPDVCFLGVDPLALPGDGGAEGLLAITMSGNGGRGTAAGSPTPVRLVVVAAESGPRRALWLGAREGEDGLAALRDLLALPPLRLSHELAGGTGGGPLREYALAVAPATAVEQGLATARELRAYVRQGGAVLLYGDPGPGGSALQALLRGAGAARPEPGLAPVRGWEGQAERALLGRGRIAHVGSRAYLRDAALGDPAGKRAAVTLVNWLLPTAAGAGARGPTDLDGDGLLDIVEDPNGNGRVDPGETNPLEPDTDGDGLADGHEDRNGDGAVDAGETNPLRRDTDGDGLWDGADPEPLERDSTSGPASVVGAVSTPE